MWGGEGGVRVGIYAEYLGLESDGAWVSERVMLSIYVWRIS